MPKPPKALSPKMSQKAARSKQGRKTKWDPAMVEVVENIVSDTGVLGEAHKVIGVAKATLYRWIEEKKDLSDALARAVCIH